MSLTNTTEAQESETAIKLDAAKPRSGSKWQETMNLIVVLFKLRVVFLLLLAATGGAFLAAGGWPGLGALLLIWFAGGMAAAGSSSFNQYWERHSDGDMIRTRKRPLVNGDISNPKWVPVISGLLIFIPVLFVLTFNPAMAFFLLLGAFIYTILYTILLKPRTLVNIVIGGAAGSAAVLTGSAAAGQWNETGALILALILFLWTPFHFWSLALLYREDYSRSDVPMLPVNTTPHRAAWWIMIHTLPTCIFGVLLVVLPTLGWLYFIPVVLVSFMLFWRNVQLIRDPSPPNARAMFMASNYYLTVLLLAVYAGTVARSLLA
jgi:protoheme IX farnesyltransferase